MHPPQWLIEWTPVIWPLLGLILIPLVRAFVVKPLQESLRIHAEQHEHMGRELVVNGDEYLLPKHEQNLPMRTLVIKTMLALRTHEQEMMPLITQYRQDLRDRGP